MLSERRQGKLKGRASTDVLSNSCGQYTWPQTCNCCGVTLRVGGRILRDGAASLGAWPVRTRKCGPATWVKHE